jgi:hypothetical protein
VTFIAKPIRVEPVFDDAKQVRDMFERHAPYPAVAAYGLDVFVDETKHPEAERSILPWFRGNWALSGKPLVDGAEVILHNRKFLEAARAVFGTSRVYPEFVVVNINAPMPAGRPDPRRCPFFLRSNARKLSLAVSGSDGQFRTVRSMARNPGGSDFVVL